MPISLSKITAKTKTIAVEWEGETVQIDYSPSQYTPAYIDALAAKQKEAEAEADTAKQGEKFSEMACEVVKAWDIQGDDGAVLPVSVAAMSQLPVSLIQRFIESITGDLSPNARGGSVSNGSF